jgi:hypothetical protein
VADDDTPIWDELAERWAQVRALLDEEEADDA